MQENSHPIRAFLSHASEDKERFAREFAAKLRASGIDVWLDEWEILPGDSLVGKIFEEGLKNADVLLIVLSKYSVRKPWVREELNAGIVKRITEKTRIIPIVIEDCEIPEALKSTVWIRISDFRSYETELRKIVDAIYGIRSKPPLGPPPNRVLASAPQIAGLTIQDAVVLRLACEHAIKSDQSWIQPESLAEPARASDVNDAELQESLTVLDEHGYIKAKRAIGGIYLFEIQPFGLEQYLRHSWDNYDNLIHQIAIYILNETAQSAMELVRLTSAPRVIIDHVLTIFESQGYLKPLRAVGDTIWTGVSPRFRRSFSAK